MIHNQKMEELTQYSASRQQSWCTVWRGHSEACGPAPPCEELVALVPKSALSNRHQLSPLQRLPQPYQTSKFKVILGGRYPIIYHCEYKGLIILAQLGTTQKGHHGSRDPTSWPRPSLELHPFWTAPFCFQKVPGSKVSRFSKFASIYNDLMATFSKLQPLGNNSQKVLFGCLVLQSLPLLYSEYSWEIDLGYYN